MLATLGGVLYRARWFVLLIGLAVVLGAAVFGYHEVFHLLVIAGNAAVAVVVLTWAMPLL